MNADDAENVARPALAEVADLGEVAYEVSAGDALFDFGLSSLSAVEPALVPEERFGTTVPNEALFLDQFSSIAKIVALSQHRDPR